MVKYTTTSLIEVLEKFPEEYSNEMWVVNFEEFSGGE